MSLLQFKLQHIISQVQKPSFISKKLLEQINAAIELIEGRLEIYTPKDGITFQYDDNLSLEESTELYQKQILLAEDLDDEKDLDPEARTQEIYLKTAKNLLVRYRDSVENLLKEVYLEIKGFFKKREYEKLKDLLQGSDWMKGTLSYEDKYNKKLGILAIELPDLYMLSIIFDQDPEIEQYKQSLLIQTIQQGNVQVVKMLFGTGKYQPEDLAQLLGCKCYYGTTQEIIELFAQQLQGSEQEIQSIYYQAMYFYKQGGFEPALKLFERVSGQDSAFALDALLHLGLCHQAIKTIDKAREIFKQVVVQQKEEEAEVIPVLNSTERIKKIAQEHLNAIEAQESRKEALYNKVSQLQQLGEEKDNSDIYQNFSQEHLNNIVQSLNKLGEFLDDPSQTTHTYNELQQHLCQIKYVWLKNKFPEEFILMQEFSDIEELQISFKEKLNPENLDALQRDYTIITKIVEDTISLIGDTTEGLLVEV